MNLFISLLLMDSGTQSFSSVCLQLDVKIFDFKLSSIFFTSSTIHDKVISIGILQKILVIDYLHRQHCTYLFRIYRFTRTDYTLFLLLWYPYPMQWNAL